MDLRPHTRSTHARSTRRDAVLVAPLALATASLLVFDLVSLAALLTS